MVHTTSSSAFSLQLDNLVKGNSIILPIARCTFSYYWDGAKSIGKAQLLGINGNMLSIPLFQKKNGNPLHFLSNMQPTEFQIQGRAVVIERVALRLDADGQHGAALYFKEEGAVIQATPNYPKNR